MSECSGNVYLVKAAQMRQIADLLESANKKAKAIHLAESYEQVGLDLMFLDKDTEELLVGEFV